MSTLRRPSDKGQSTWDFLGAAGARLSAYLVGQYAYSFSNTSGRTVKMHLTDDTGRPGDRGQDYFLTVPANAEGIEVPMKSDMIIVTAGFFKPEDGTYEIFWQNRRFSWESDISICACPKHSVDANRICVDVFPGAQELPRGGARARASGQTFRMLMLPDTIRNLDGIRVFSRRPGGGRSASEWQSSDLRKALPDGSLEVTADEGSRSLVQPVREASLLALPPGISAAEFTSACWTHPAAKTSQISELSDMGLPPAHLRHPRDKIRDVAGSFVSSYASFSTAAPSPVSTPGRR